MSVKRNRTATVKGGPMGEEASVTFRVPTIGAVKQQQKVAKQFGVESDEADRSAREFFAEHVLAWNWVDDEGNPLPSPHGNPDIFDDLTNDELHFIATSLNGKKEEQEQERKNLQ